VRVVARNLEVPRGEIDLVVDDRGARVVVEVRTVRGTGDPIDAVGEGKRRKVRSLASNVGATRVDFLGVALRGDAVEFHWVPG
jgi:Holliday junction resolvase-like predicted endonuclease